MKQKKKRVMLVRPKPSPDTIGLQHLMVVEPLELEILASSLRRDHEVQIVDMILEKEDISHFIQAYRPDVFCITGYITHVTVMKQYCMAAKEINESIVTIAGGVHIEKFPEDINHPSIDYRVVRNASITFPQLIDFLSGNADFPPGVLRKDELLNEGELPDYDFSCFMPDRSLTEKYRHRYFYVFHNKVALIKTSFGCPFHCRFCFCRKITGDRYFARPLGEVMEELSAIREKEIYIVDDDFLVSAARTREFIGLLKSRGVKKRFLVYGRADFIAANPDLIMDFREAGLRTVIVGLESFEDSELSGFNKQTTLNINKQAMAVLNRFGVDCYAAVIISPSWDRHDFRKAGDVMLSLGIRFVNLQPLTPLKGTGLQVKEEDLVISRSDYARWDLAHVTIRPEKMSLEDFYRNILNLYLRIIFHPRNLVRLLRYPLRMQFRMAKGMRLVMKQYKSRIMEVADHA